MRFSVKRCAYSDIPNFSGPIRNLLHQRFLSRAGYRWSPELTRSDNQVVAAFRLSGMAGAGKSGSDACADANAAEWRTTTASCRTTSHSWTSAWQRRDSLRGAQGVFGETRPIPQAQCRLGRADPGRALDENVIADWKKLLGSDWDKTYAASNTIYVARQNNVLFSVLAQYFGPDAINDRLLLIETMSFTTTPSDMLESLTRLIADRSVGALFFGNYHLMDYELMGGDARTAIIAEDTKRDMKPFLPSAEVPFGSKQWPTLITPGPGPASICRPSLMPAVGRARGPVFLRFQWVTKSCLPECVQVLAQAKRQQRMGLSHRQFVASATSWGHRPAQSVAGGVAAVRIFIRASVA